MKPAPIDYDTVREMLRTATPDRVLRFIGKSHPADIALLFKGLDSAEVRQLFDVLFSSRRAATTLKELPLEDKRTIGREIAKVQFGWPVGAPAVPRTGRRSLGGVVDMGGRRMEG